MPVLEHNTGVEAVDDFLAYLRAYFQREDAKPKARVASDAGISRMYLHDLIEGNKTQVSLDVAARLATAMGTSLGKILEQDAVCG